MQAIDAVLQQSVASSDLPGVVAAVATDAGVVYEGAFGKRTLDTEPAMTADTVFRIASMTKAVASVALMQLYERGKFALDQPAGEILPELGSVEVLDGFGGDGQPRLRPAQRPVTPRQLLTHTAGFSYEMWNADLKRYQETTGREGVLGGKKAGLRMPLVCDPGTRWEYGVNTDWVGLLVEALSGQTLAAYLEANVFAPLGMTDTGFRRTPEQETRTAGVHQRGVDGTLTPSTVELVRGDAEYDSGGHGLNSTAADYLTFQRMLLGRGSHNGARILESDTVALMAENHIGALDVGRMSSVAPPVSNDVQFAPGIVHKHGLGFLINTAAYPGGRAAGSLAWAGLLNTYYWIDPTRRVAGVILTQMLPFFDAKVIPTYDRFEKATYRALNPN